MNNMRALEFDVQGQHLPVLLSDGRQLLLQHSLEPLVPGDAQQGGAGTAEAEGRSGGADQSLNLLIVRNQLLAVTLMKAIQVLTWTVQLWKVTRTQY